MNLSSHKLTDDQKGFLNLGPNCYLQPKFDLFTKKSEIEILHQSLSQLKVHRDIAVHTDMRDDLKAEGLRNCSSHNNYNNILTTKLKITAKEIKNNPNIVIRQVEKANTYIIYNIKQISIKKLQNIIDDQTHQTKQKPHGDPKKIHL